jgi:hypothetical protein
VAAARTAVNCPSLIAVHSPFSFNSLRHGEVVLYRVLWGAKPRRLWGGFMGACLKLLVTDSVAETLAQKHNESPQAGSKRRIAA